MDDKELLDSTKNNDSMKSALIGAFVLLLAGGTSPWWAKPVGDFLSQKELKEEKKVLENKNKELTDKNKELSDKNKELIKELDIFKDNIAKQENLALFSGYEVNYNLDTSTRDIGVGLILSEQTRSKIEKTSLEKIEAVVIFATGQRFVNLWITDTRGNSYPKLLQREEGKPFNPERSNELSFELLVSNFPQVDPRSISKIVFEAKAVPFGYRSFIVKRVNLK
ncbi:hypothetical protein [Pseudanabaena sp. Chao 1811]|uniref:hypothetical protein n=1 Tax=Pseudanabaena sp. Chao 1811 TaxID=2963092 RepID=UPI0022F3E5C1|nr:hypothetical protein [Pseudanabaena sp. Chao 1811]